MVGSTIRRLVLAAAVLAAGMGGMAAASDEAPTGDVKEFVACMRSHGLPDFPEVAVSSDGLVNLHIKGERVDVLSKTYGAAVKACESLLPAGKRLPQAPTAPVAPSLPS
ncbi:hypothetical protein ETD86_20505 [Nonomuraea turkmeniaca]|uniref:Uncharacterized protein n=1 Tax=Nonomuraea turkmeniaca TaxID=103838 RepID=A0A5S4FH21_9ACTN|nr:hypothetical protein [Nonomuraea turkmeniaca]TMR19248.1 hypothetical protein ETD86_20505 [Nonomuraea turkmeniaca]